MQILSGETHSAKTGQVARTAGSYRAGWLVFSVPFGVALLIYNLTAAAGLSWRHGGDDGGDLAVAMGLYGIPHPTGYPLYLLSSRPFLLFSAEPARALNLASACWGALAAGLLGLATFQMTQTIFNRENFNSLSYSKATSDETGIASAGGIVAGLLLAFAPLSWSQALIAEVYSFNLMLTALLLLTLVRWWKKPIPTRLLIFGLVLGLATSHHRTALFTGLAAGIFVIVALKSPPKPDTAFVIKNPGLFWIKFALIVFAGLFLPYLYLLLRGGAVPASNWSDAGITNFEGLWQQFSGSDYRGLVLAAPLSQSIGRISASINLLLQQFGLGGLILGWLGLVIAWLTVAARPLFWLALSGIILHAGFAAVYAADNSQVYLLPAFMLWAVLIGWGFSWAALKLRMGWPRRKWAYWPILVVLGMALPVFSLIANYARLDLSNDRSAESWAKTRLSISPPNAILLSYSDATTFAVWYGQYIQNQRPDLVVIDARLFSADWYRRNLARLYPNLSLSSEAKIAAAKDLASILAVANPARPVLIVTEPPGIANGLP